VWNVVRVVGALGLGAGLALRGWRSGSLDRSGALAAAVGRPRGSGWRGGFRVRSETFTA